MTPKQQIEYWQRYEAIRIRVEARGRKRFRALLNRQTKAVLAHLNTHGHAHTLDALSRLISNQDLALLMSDFYAVEGLPFAIREFEQVSGQKSHYVAGLRLKRFGLNISASFFSEYWKRLLVGFVSANAASKVTGINDTTRKTLRELITEAMNNRLTLRETAKLIRDKMGIMNRWRAANIARTEANGAANYAASVGAESAAKLLTNATLEKFWIATADTRTRDAHRAMIGQKPIPIDGFFVVGGERLKRPGDPNGSARNICNCRCVLAHKVVRT